MPPPPGKPGKHPPGVATFAGDGKALRYRLHPGDDGFLLHSVGEDGKDDGGNPARQEEKKSYRQIWDGRDAVWPSAATAEEAKLAVGTRKHD